MPRPSWDSYFSKIAAVVATRATCDRKWVGAVIVDERHRILACGYNGSPCGTPHCDDAGHEMRDIDGRQSCVRTIHAEANALIDAGAKARGCTLYVTCMPCHGCAKLVASAGIKRVVYAEEYRSQNTDLTVPLFEAAGVVLDRVPTE